MNKVSGNTCESSELDTSRRETRKEWGFSKLVVWAFIPAFVGVSIFLSLPGFDAPMIYDSKSFILGKSHAFASQDVTDALQIVPSRPLFLLTLYANYLARGMDPAFFRLINALILALASIVLVWMTFLVYEVADRADSRAKHRTAAAIAVGLLFLVHPLQSLVVLYIWQREACMACLFFFAAVGAYLCGGGGRSKYPNMWRVLTGVLFLAGMLSNRKRDYASGHIGAGGNNPVP